MICRCMVQEQEDQFMVQEDEITTTKEEKYQQKQINIKRTEYRKNIKLIGNFIQCHWA